MGGDDASSRYLHRTAGADNGGAARRALWRADLGLLPASPFGVSEQPPLAASSSKVAAFRNLLAVAGLLLWIAFLIPPVSSWSLRYEYAQAIQYCVFAVLAPALLVAGA